MNAVGISIYLQRDWGVGDVDENNNNSDSVPTTLDANDVERYGTSCVLLRKLPAWIMRKALEVCFLLRAEDDDADTFALPHE